MPIIEGPSLKGHHVLYTSKGLLKWSITASVVGLGLHLAASFGLLTGTNWYNTPSTASVDVFTHSLAGLTIGLWLLNLNMGDHKALYWCTAITATVITGIGWEGFEIVYSKLFPEGTIQVFGARDVIQDLWQDTLGGVVACFIAEETVESKKELQSSKKS